MWDAIYLMPVCYIPTLYHLWRLAKVVPTLLFHAVLLLRKKSIRSVCIWRKYCEKFVTLTVVNNNYLQLVDWSAFSRVPRYKWLLFWLFVGSSSSVAWHQVPSEGWHTADRTTREIPQSLGTIFSLEWKIKIKYSVTDGASNLSVASQQIATSRRCLQQSLLLVLKHLCASSRKLLRLSHDVTTCPELPLLLRNGVKQSATFQRG